MTPLVILAGVVLVVVLATGWRLRGLAARVEKAHRRVERAWILLDAALTHRARRAAQLADSADLDPASALLLWDAASTALDPELPPAERERAESDLSQVLAIITPAALVAESDRATLGRRLHNDAVATARSLRERRTVQAFRLAARTTVPRAFEMADPAN